MVVHMPKTVGRRPLGSAPPGAVMLDRPGTSGLQACGDVTAGDGRPIETGRV